MLTDDLALKWHPDRWMKDPVVGGEAKRRFQQIQEASSVLLDKGKRKVYDAGLIGLLAEDDGEDRQCSLQDLQGLLVDMMADEQRIQFEFDGDNSQNARKKTCV